MTFDAARPAFPSFSETPSLSEFQSPQQIPSTESQAGTVSELATFLTSRAIKSLLGRPANWDFRGSDAPRKTAVNLASELVKTLNERVVAAAESRFTTASVSADEDGNVVLEWWHGAKKLALHIPDDAPAQYVKVWGPRIDVDMEEGELEDREFHLLWRWLNS
jgi:hypothetical protein